MVVELRSRTEEELSDNDYRDMVEIYIDEEKKFSVYDGEPEDSNLSRDFSDCHSIVDLMQLAYDAGKRGEEFIVK